MFLAKSRDIVSNFFHNIGRNFYLHNDLANLRADFTNFISILYFEH